MSSQNLQTFELIDRLNLLISETRTIPFTNKLPLDKEELTALLHRLEASLPDDIQQAKQIIAQEKKVIDESRKLAEDTIREANKTARTTVDNANSQAKAAVQDAQQKAAQTLQEATNSANAMVADAQNRANMMVQEAQNHAQQLISESEIVARAQAQAQEMLDSTHRECEEYSMRVHGTVSQMLETADVEMTRQLDELRALRQEISVNQYVPRAE